ncbi:hypothetical protein ACTVMJ_24225, partial [Serratia marcescens]
YWIVYCLRFNDKKNRILPPVNQRIIAPDIHPVMSVIDKKGNRKRRSQATLMVLFYYFVLLRQKKLAAFSVPTLIRRCAAIFTT